MNKTKGKGSFFSNMIHKKGTIVLPVQMPSDISNHGKIMLIKYADDYFLLL
jgi:hypothetical protein